MTFDEALEVWRALSRHTSGVIERFIEETPELRIERLWQQVEGLHHQMESLRERR